MFMRMCLDKKGAIRSGLWRNKTEPRVLPRGVRKGTQRQVRILYAGVLHDGLLNGKIRMSLCVEYRRTCSFLSSCVHL